jgi:hypothetical protein
VEMANVRQAGKTLNLVLGDRHRFRARRQGRESLAAMLSRMERDGRQRLPTPSFDGKVRALESSFD